MPREETFESFLSEGQARIQVIFEALCSCFTLAIITLIPFLFFAMIVLNIMSIQCFDHSYTIFHLNTRHSESDFFPEANR